MFCGNCGATMPEGALVCPQCGTKITDFMNEQQSEAPVVGAAAPGGEAAFGQTDFGQAASIASEAPKQGMSEKKKVILLAGGAAAVLCVVFIIAAVVFMTGKSGSGSRKDVIFGEIIDESTALFCDAKGNKKDIDDVYDIKLSGDRTKAVYITRDDYMLYYVDNKLKPVKIADEVVSVQMSITGDYFAYTTSDDRDYSDCTLYLYNAKKNKNEKIASGVHASYVCVSPSGKSVAYVKNYESDNDNDLYLSIDGKEGNKIGREGGFPVAVSDDGKKFFYIKFDEDDYSYDLQFYNGKESTKIAGDVSGSTMYTNKSVSELLYGKDGKTYYFNTKKKEPQRASSNYLYKLSASSSNIYNLSASMSIGAAIGISNPYSVTYDLDSLTNAFYMTSEGSLVWLSRDGSETAKVTSKYDAWAVSEDGRTLVYLNKGALYKAEKFSANAEPKQLCEDQDAISLVASKDLSRIYLITDDDELCYYRDKKSVVKISNDLESRMSVAYNELDQKVYFVENDDLYSATTNDKKKKVESDVEGVASYGDFVMYLADDGDSIYLAAKNRLVEVYQFPDERFVQQDESALAEIENAVKIACSVEVVYKAMSVDTTVTISDGAQVTSSCDELTNELRLIIPDEIVFRSKKYKGTTQTVTIHIDDDTGIVSVDGSWHN